MNSLTRYCKCGSSISVSGTIDGMKQALQIWFDYHKGIGHGLTTPAKCRAARTARENKVVANER